MIIYLFKSTLLLGLLYVLYRLMLENEKMHRFNRFFLLLALIFGLTAPLISFEIHPDQTIAGIEIQQMERVGNAPAEAVSNSVEPLITPDKNAKPRAEITPLAAEEPGWPFSALEILLGLYVLVTYFLLIRFAGGLLEIWNKIKAGNLEKAGPANLVLLDGSVTPQSFFKYIFLEKESFKNGKIEPEILDHELTHVRQLHSLDVLFIEFLKVIFWFNPFMYLYKHAIQLNHEFIADESVISNSSSISDYQDLLIRVSSGNKQMSTTSGISYSLTKKRMKMMAKKFSAFRSGSKGIFLLPLILSFSLMFCTQSKEKSYPHKVSGSTDKLYTNVNLYVNPQRSDELNIEQRGMGIRYDSAGNPFTGTQQFRDVNNDQLLSESEYVDGILKSTTAYHDDGSLKLKYEYGYVGQKFKTTKHYNEDGLMIEEWVNPTSTDSLGYIKQWHPNGQLKYEAYYIENLQYQGLMTLYDKQGNIIEQERYENGELIEKIK
ncbi:hypothetical protein G3570_13290 [Balneolaceae bacterium YR4-1]|uniref:Peptidase M56 domain-containing protein n=1 Tax=Halalkalibaculum roseum TaxID=2709311 RepID=A0A6M1T4C8_9BACT|nr:hypothetical protein [Halalkalibaculum roseum]